MLIGLVLVGLAFTTWLLVLTAVLGRTRPRDVPPAPASAALPSDASPAVVRLLANRWRPTGHAAGAILLDLAARRWLELRQPGDDPGRTTVHLLREPRSAEPLTGCEQMVLERVRAEVVGGLVPLSALTFREPGAANRWTARMHREVIDEARGLGLSRRRLSVPLVRLLGAAAALPAVVTGLVIVERGAGTGAGLCAGLLIWGGLAAVAGRAQGERDTPAGREAAARWLGLRAFLRNDGTFAELPPAAVAGWDRYLAYGDALGVTRVCAMVLDLGMGSRAWVWSSFGGRWHRVRVRYPRFRVGYGATPVFALAAGVGALAVGVLLLRTWFVLDDLTGEPPGVIGVLAALIGSCLGGCGLYRLVRLGLDLVAPRRVRGQVLWIEPCRRAAATGSTPGRPLLHHLAVDDGSGTRTTAWALPSRWSGSAGPGDVITMTVRPWTRRVTSLQVEARHAARPGAAPEAPARGSRRPRPRRG